MILNTEMLFSLIGDAGLLSNAVSVSNAFKGRHFREAAKADGVAKLA